MATGDRQGPRLQQVPGDPGDPAGFPVIVVAFETWMRVRGYTGATIEARRRAIVFFVAWLAERNITRPVEVTRVMIERYQRHLFQLRKPNGQPLALRSQAARLAPLRALFKWAVRHHIVAVNPAAELELPRMEQRLPKPALTISEAEQVLRCRTSVHRSACGTGQCSKFSTARECGAVSSPASTSTMLMLNAAPFSFVRGRVAKTG